MDFWLQTFIKEKNISLLHYYEAIDYALKSKFYPYVQANFNSEGQLVINWTKNTRMGFMRQAYLGLLQKLSEEKEKDEKIQELIDSQRFLVRVVEEYYLFEGYKLPTSLDSFRRELQDVQNVVYKSEYGVSKQERARRKKAERYYKKTYGKNPRVKIGELSIKAF